MNETPRPRLIAYSVAVLAPAAQGQLDDARPLVVELDAMAKDLILAVDGLSLENLRQQTMPADDSARRALGDS